MQGWQGGAGEMALTYDFDMVPVTPEGLPDGEPATDGGPRAMFRDPTTVAALGRADAAVQSFFIESGFALQQHDSGAPPGRFPMRDEDARVAVIEKLSANLMRHDLKGADWGGFAFADFMQALAGAEPVADALLAPVAQSSGPARTAHVSSRKTQGRKMIALGGLLLGVILLIYVAGQMLV